MVHLGKVFLFHTVNILAPDLCGWDTGQTQPMCEHDHKEEMSNSRAMPHLQASLVPFPIAKIHSAVKLPVEEAIALGSTHCSSSWLHRSPHLPLSRAYGGWGEPFVTFLQVEQKLLH